MQRCSKSGHNQTTGLTAPSANCSGARACACEAFETKGPALAKGFGSLPQHVPLSLSASARGVHIAVLQPPLLTRRFQNRS